MLGRSKNFTLRGFLWLLSLMAIPVILVMAHTSLVFAQNGTILTPHKAVYGISLASTFGAEAPSGIRGVMSFEFADKCNGWQTDTKILLRTAHGAGPEV